MPIYKQTTEITNIDDLLSSVERDIEEVYFGDKNVFTVWDEYDGTLPATYTANGSTLGDYRIYGSAGGVGNRTENLFDNTACDTSKGYMNSTLMYADGSTTSNAGYVVSEYIPVASNTDYYLTNVNGTGTYPSVCFYDENKVYISGTAYTRKQSLDITTPSGTAYLRMTTAKYLIDVSMLTPGSTAPAEYVPYGYVVPMSVLDGTTSTTTQIYIGGTPLGEDEYVDYGEGKIYRMSGGVLTPTDPPVPLPALPTCDGTTITGYAGQSAAVPSRFVAKYRKQNF